MDQVIRLFEFMRDSNWIQDLYTYDMSVDPSDSESIGKVLLELSSSNWSDDLYTYEPDITEAGIKFMSIRDMRNLYLSNLLTKVGLDSDTSLKIAEMI